MGDIKFVHTTKNHGKLTEIQNIVFELIQLLITIYNYNSNMSELT